MGELAAVVDHEYRGDRLEQGIKRILEQHADELYLETRSDGFTQRCRAWSVP